MSFSGAFPYGTGGGEDDFNKPQSPADVRIAQGRSFVIFLTVNGPVTERLREHVEDVIRVLGLQAENLLAIIVRDSGTVDEPDLTNANFAEALLASNIGVAAIGITIPANGLVSAHFMDSTVTLLNIAASAVTTPKLADNTLVNADFAVGAAIPFSKLAGVSPTVHNHNISTYINQQSVGNGTNTLVSTCNAGDTLLSCGCDCSDDSNVKHIIPNLSLNRCECRCETAGGIFAYALCWDNP